MTPSYPSLYSGSKSEGVAAALSGGYGVVSPPSNAAGSPSVATSSTPNNKIEAIREAQRAAADHRRAQQEERRRRLEDMQNRTGQRNQMHVSPFIIHFSMIFLSFKKS